LTKIQTDRLIQAIQQHYGIEIESLRFLQRGWGGDCFAIDTPAAERFFLKVHDGDEHDVAASSKAFYLPLMHQLHSKGILSHIPHPVPTLGGEFSTPLGSFELVITHFIDGRLIGFGTLPEPVLRELSKMVGILHNSRSQLDFDQPFIERFEMIPERDFWEVFNALEAVNAADRVGRHALRDALLPHQGKILAALGYQKTLQTTARGSNKPMVVCHTDLHGANLMGDDRGNLYILDWENALIAPPEHDMIFFAGEPNFWEVFWPHYHQQFQDASLDPEILRFYFYRRALEDIFGIARRILLGDGDEARDREDLGYLEEGLAGLGAIDQTISKFIEGGTRGGIPFQ